jgi:hypothetical protein
MNDYDDDFDPEHESDESEGSETETLVWQLLLLINPGDEESALQQFGEYQEAVAEVDEDELEPMEYVSRVIDWRSGFQVDEQDTRALVQAIDELASRWNVTIDWNGDPDEDEFHEDQDAASLFATAYDRLAEAGYTLWSWETGAETVAGFMTLTRDGEPLRELATVLHINLRLGSDLS